MLAARSLRRILLVAVVLCAAAPGAAFAATGSIHGAVTSQTSGAVTPNYTVELYSSAMLKLSSVCTDADGKYGFTGLGTASYYVFFSGNTTTCGDNSFAPEWWNGHGPAAFADPVGVTDGTDTPGINASLLDGATISGTAYVGTNVNAKVANVSARILDTSGAEVARACTDAAGRYSATRLTGGVYGVEFVSDGSCGAVDPYVTQYYKDSDTAAAAAAVNLGNGETSDGNDAHLRLPPASTTTPVPTSTATATTTPTPTGNATPAPGTTATVPTCQVTPAVKRKAGKIKVKVVCDQVARLVLRGKVRFKHKTLKLKRSSVTAAKKTFKLKVPAKARKHKLSVSFKLIASNAAGTSTVKLKSHG